jgi:hypothetical protein
MITFTTSVRATIWRPGEAARAFHVARSAMRGL